MRLQRGTIITDTEKRRWLRGVQSWFAARSLWIGLAAAGGAPIINALLPGAAGSTRTLLTAAAVLLASAGFAVPAAKSSQAEERAELAEQETEAAETSMRVALADALLPALSYVVSAVDPHAPDAGQGPASAEAIPLVLQAAAQICGRRGRTRASWYELIVDPEDGRRKLTPKRHVGRGSRPGIAFDLGQARGQALERMVREDKTELWPDLQVTLPPDWIQTGDRTYETFLMVGVRTELSGYGLLSVDADEPNVFGQADVDLVRVLAWLLALALSRSDTPSAE